MCGIPSWAILHSMWGRVQDAHSQHSKTHTTQQDHDNWTMWMLQRCQHAILIRHNLCTLFSSHFASTLPLQLQLPTQTGYVTHKYNNTLLFNARHTPLWQGQSFGHMNIRRHENYHAHVYCILVCTWSMIMYSNSLMSVRCLSTSIWAITRLVYVHIAQSHQSH